MGNLVRSEGRMKNSPVSAFDYVNEIGLLFDKKYNI